MTALKNLFSSLLKHPLTGMIFTIIVMVSLTATFSLLFCLLFVLFCISALYPFGKQFFYKHHEKNNKPPKLI